MSHSVEVESFKTMSHWSCCAMSESIHELLDCSGLTADYLTSFICSGLFTLTCRGLFKHCLVSVVGTSSVHSTCDLI